MTKSKTKHKLILKNMTT